MWSNCSPVQDSAVPPESRRMRVPYVRRIQAVAVLARFDVAEHVHLPVFQEAPEGIGKSGNPDLGRSGCCVRDGRMARKTGYGGGKGRHAGANEVSPADSIEHLFHDYRF